MDEVDLQITGLGALEQRLLDYDKRTARAALSAGLRAGARVVLQEAKARVRVKTGRTKRSLKVKYLGIRGQDSTYTVQSSYFVARFLEFGTSKMPAYPFLRPATEAAARAAVEAIMDTTYAKLGAR